MDRNAEKLSEKTEKNPKIKIAFFQQDLGVGGIQRSMVNLLRNLDYSRADVTLWLGEKESFWEEKFPKELKIRALPPLKGVWKFLPFSLAMKLALPGFPEEGAEPYDLAADFNSYQTVCALGALKIPAKRRVMWIHNDVEIKYHNEWKYRVLWRAFRGKLRRYDGFIPVNASLIEPFQRLSGIDDKPYTVIHNYIDVETIREKEKAAFPDISPAPRPDPDCFKLVAMGRLCHQKGYDLMLPVFAEAVARRPELRLYILGDGPDRQSLEDLRDSLGLTDKVFFLGNRENPYAIMREMDAFLSTSRYEGQPLNLMEAMAVGLPLYCSRNLEAYCEGLTGYDDLAAALVEAEKQPKRPDDLEAYNRAILETIYALSKS